MIVDTSKLQQKQEKQRWKTRDNFEKCVANDTKKKFYKQFLSSNNSKDVWKILNRI